MRHNASFVYPANSLKFKVMWLLHSLKQQGDGNSGHGYSALDLFLLSGVRYSSLLSSLSKWHRWGYISRHIDRHRIGGLVYFYKLGKKGSRFLRNTWHLAPMKRYSQEINTFQQLIGQLDLTDYPCVCDVVVDVKELQDKNN